MKYANDENKKLAGWLRRTKAGKEILKQVKTPADLEYLCYTHARIKGSIAGMEYVGKHAETDDGLNWVTFADLFDEMGLKKKPVKKKKVIKYYLGGDEWVSLYGNNDFDDVLTRARTDEDFTLATHIMGSDPDYLLGQLDGCCGCVEITKKEYDQLKTIEDSK